MTKLKKTEFLDSLLNDSKSGSFLSSNTDPFLVSKCY